MMDKKQYKSIILYDFTDSSGEPRGGIISGNMIYSINFQKSPIPEIPEADLRKCIIISKSEKNNLKEKAQ